MPLAGLVAVVVGLALIVGRPEEGAGGAVHSVSGGQAGWDTLAVPGVPESVTRFLRNGQSWRAARALREHLERPGNRSPEALLLAARAEAGWGGWERVGPYLEGAAWLDTIRGGEGWYWLARAREEESRWADALEAYGRYLQRTPATQGDDRRIIAELRRGLVLLRLGRVGEGAALLARTREHAPDIGPRVDVLAAEALAERGDTAAVARLVARLQGGELERRGRLALLDARVRADDLRGALNLARAHRGAARDETARAVFGVRAARTALRMADTATAVQELRSVVQGAPGTGAAREAAGLLAGLPGLAVADHLAIASVLDRHGANRDAARAYARWLAGTGGDGAEGQQVRLRMGRALFDAGDYDGAVTALRPLASLAGSVGAEALLLTGRSEYRRGNRARARELFLTLAARHPRTEAGSEGLFLVADLAHDARQTAEAARLYRRIASEFSGTDRAGLSLMRLAGIAYVAGDFASAARTWEEYRSTYPAGERWLESTYWAGRALERAGDRAAAAERYRAARTRQPLSYYALRSAQRLREPYWPIPMDSAPAEDAAARARVEQWMHGVDLLREAGLFAEAEAEVDRWIAEAGDDQALLYALAETLNDRGYTVRGIRIGHRLERSAGRPNPRLLRIIYPFPYRAMLVAEAREKELDPFLVAALIRQESMFKARISSPVGARGLMQLMPETGRGMAAGAGITRWDTELLFQPEINAHLGTRFLADQMRAYDGSLPSVFAAYNAGPHRVQQWKAYPEYRDEELFTERIPYRETRDYVKILTRNAAIYRELYR